MLLVVVVAVAAAAVVAVVVVVVVVIWRERDSVWPHRNAGLCPTGDGAFLTDSATEDGSVSANSRLGYTIFGPKLVLTSMDCCLRLYQSR
ncbi:hypothetical protein GTR04_2370 [Trichophyton interdigitale]|uniref:Uncharacterized protein n=1 Tax=Trichophyton interdigitale TaxID=101480 RepID=A0A9P5CWU8_9EURO|nr:hypothetical protein GY631_2221 [Trichophyton interdigitale]KAF3898626.1 hypothetical protein GY632_1702 [Trichophyton interdigitale]KAG8210230.1 hypothetical protein GTR04_2370 [Trichophyton interdigitale]